VEKAASLYCRWPDPIYRRRETPREVIRRILKSAEKQPMVELVTHPENENAIRLYKGTRQIRVILYAKEPSFRASAFAVSQR